MSKKQIRIFISSPGDVVEERNQAKRVIERLQLQFPDVELEAVLWEELALPATTSFQEGIDRKVSGATIESVPENYDQNVDFILNDQSTDIAVFILRSRLGIPLGPTVTKSNGHTYRRGTELNSMPPN